MPTIDSGWLDEHQRFPPPGPKPRQKQPKQPVSWAKAPIRTSEDAELVAQGKSLEQKLSTRRRPSRSDRITRPDDSSHRCVGCRPVTPTSMDFWPDAILARHNPLTSPQPSAAAPHRRSSAERSRGDSLPAPPPAIRAIKRLPSGSMSRFRWKPVSASLVEDHSRGLSGTK